MIDLEKLELRIEQGEAGEVERILEGWGGERSGTNEAKKQLGEGLLFYRRGDYKGAITILSEAREIAAKSGPHKLEHRLMNYLIWIGLKAGLQRMIRKLFGELDKDLGRMGKREKGFFYVNHAYAVSMDIGFIESEKFSDRLVKNALEALKSAERIAAGKDQLLLLRSRLVKGLLLQQMEHWGKARSVLEEAVWSADREGLPLMKADLLEELGNLHFREGREVRAMDIQGGKSEFRKAADAYEKALALWEGKNPDEAGVLNAALGDIYYYLAEYDLALEKHTTALEIFVALHYLHGIALQRDALGRIYLRTGDTKKGIRSLKSALKIFKRLDVRHERLLTMVHLVDGYFLLSRKKGRRHLKKLLYNEPLKRYLDCYRELKEIVMREEWLREDPELKELFMKPPARFITLELLEQIIQAAKKAHPNEFGGLIHGDPVMDRLEFVLDSAKGTDTFMFSLYNRYSGDYLYADGSVHSHPSGAAVPSKADLSFFGRFPNVNIIIGYPYALDSWAAYDRNGNRLKVAVIYRGDKEKVEDRLKKFDSKSLGSKSDHK